MRPLLIAVAGLLIVGTVSLAAPAAEAATSCVRDIHEPGPEPCGGIFCYGYTGGQWQNCGDLKPPP